jgi:hypothetical protein
MVDASEEAVSCAGLVLHSVVQMLYGSIGIRILAGRGALTTLKL